jgi:hypothetical protein
MKKKTAKYFLVKNPVFCIPSYNFVLNQGQFKSSLKSFYFLCCKYLKKEILLYGKPSMTCFKYQVYCTCTVQTPLHECYTFSGYRKLFYVFITLFLECFVNCTGHSNLFLFFPFIKIILPASHCGRFLPFNSILMVHLHLQV